MTIPGDGSSPPNPAMFDRSAGPDDGHAAVAAIDDALAALGELDSLPVADHVERFEAVHAALADALSTADTLLSGTSGHGS